MRLEDVAGRAAGTVRLQGAEGLHGAFRGRPRPGQWGLGQGRAAWTVVQGLASTGVAELVLLGALPPHSLQVVPASGGWDGEEAGRRLLERCLLSQGLISKTGRLVLTEAGAGTAAVPARLSPPAPPPVPLLAASPETPSNISAPTPSHVPEAAPLGADQGPQKGPLGRLCQLWEDWSGGGGGVGDGGRTGKWRELGARGSRSQA